MLGSNLKPISKTAFENKKRVVKDMADRVDHDIEVALKGISDIFLYIDTIKDILDDLPKQVNMALFKLKQLEELRDDLVRHSD